MAARLDRPRNRVPLPWLALMLAMVLSGSLACSEVDKGPTAPDPPPSPSPPPKPPPPPAPRLQFTKFLAFGDSLTYGTVSASPSSSAFALGPPTSYPALLHGSLQDRYADQTIVLTNDGVPGERLRAGLVRLTNRLPELRPDVLLLLEGANDLGDCAHRFPSEQPGCVEQAIAELDQLARQARLTLRDDGEGFVVLMLATLPPQRNTAASSFVARFNDGVRAIANAEGAILVDLFAALGPNPRPALIGADGLHLTTQGYEVTAQAFFQAIVSQPGWETQAESTQ